MGTVVCVDYNTGFIKPEMVKSRLAVVISPKIQARNGLCTVVPLSTTDPPKVMPYHYQFTIHFKMPVYWGNLPRWVKGDMMSAVSYRRVELLRLGKDKNGERIYQTQTINREDLLAIRKCVLHGLGLSTLTKQM